MKDLDFFLGFTELNGECMEWTRCLNTDGYPRSVWKGSSNGKVHRIVAELSGQDIDGKVVRHTCHNTKCINPDHLLTGTPADNIRDMDEADRRYRTILDDKIKTVRMLLDGGMKQKRIAEVVGIDPRRVSDIKTGKITPRGFGG